MEEAQVWGEVGGEEMGGWFVRTSRGGGKGRGGVAHPVAAMARCYGAVCFSKDHTACDGGGMRGLVEGNGCVWGIEIGPDVRVMQ